jgi:predicted alpha/beta superfamily hydrolase
MADYVLYHLGPFDVPGLRARKVRVYVPPRAHGATSPALFMFDGQNVFDDEPSFAGGWALHKAAHALQKKRGRAPVIIGVDHGHEARIGELSPWPGPHGGGQTDVLLGWMVSTLMPQLRGELRLASDPREVGIGGSSLGGLGALYAHLTRPDVFGMAMALSPSLWVGQGKIFALVGTKPKPAGSRIYLDAGGLEGGGHMLKAATRMAAELRARGWDDSSLWFRSVARGKHSEKDWRRRAPGAMDFLFGGRGR